MYDGTPTTVEEWLDTEDQACKDIVEKKYLHDIDGRKETFSEMIDRVADNDKEAKKLILSGKFIPGGRIIANRGLYKRGIKATYSNCYVDDPPQDNIESIYESCKRLARTFSYGGGCGIDISNLAPRGAKVRNAANKSSGAVSFIEAFSDTAKMIGTEGRRAALMVSMIDSHPDLMEFISYKSDLNNATSCNMSVRVTDEFMKAVIDDRDWTMSFTREETGEIITKTLPAREIYQKMVEMNWDYAEPGMLFWDNICKYNLMSCDPTFSYAGVNPCAEECLPANGDCLLGAINLSKYAYNNNELGPMFDYSIFKKDIHTAIRFLNTIQEEGATLHPHIEQTESALTYKQIGLGVMGLADAFIRMHLRYGSENSIAVLDKIGYLLAFEAICASAALAREKGSFPKCHSELIIQSEFFQKNVVENPYYNDDSKQEVIDTVRQYGLRNSQLLTCAPTGTISTIFNVSGGIEPLFALEYERTTKTIYDKDKTYTAHPKAIADLIKVYGSLEEVKKLPFIVTARDIDWKDRIKVQATLQRHIDASISSTVNLPESATVEEVGGLYMEAWKNGLKGITIYRENCKRFPILKDTSSKSDNTETEDNGIQSAPEEASEKHVLRTREDLGEVLEGRTYYEKVACGHIYITINRDSNDMPVEVFMQSSKSGGCAANTNALGRFASTALRYGMDPELVIDSAIGVKCAACSNVKGRNEPISGLSCADVMCRAIRTEWERCKKIKEAKKKNTPIQEKTTKAPNLKKAIRVITAKDINSTIYNGTCPECGNKLLLSEGCLKCMACGWSKC